MVNQTAAHDLSSAAQKVWAAGSVDEKRSVLLEMIDQMKFKSKQSTFVREVRRMTNLKFMDQFAASLMLCDRDKVV